MNDKQNVYSWFPIEWRCVSPGPNNGWASCYKSVAPQQWRCVNERLTFSEHFALYNNSCDARALSGTHTDVSAVMVAHRLLSSAMRCRDCSDWPLHSLMLCPSVISEVFLCDGHPLLYCFGSVLFTYLTEFDNLGFSGIIT